MSSDVCQIMNRLVSIYLQKHKYLIMSLKNNNNPGLKTTSANGHAQPAAKHNHLIVAVTQFLCKGTHVVDIVVLTNIIFLNFIIAEVCGSYQRI